jgi:hypothetical protein
MEVTVSWDMTPCSLIDVLMSMRRHTPEDCNFQELSLNLGFAIALKICWHIPIWVMSGTLHEDVRTVA